jgi:hypothetical protein
MLLGFVLLLIALDACRPVKRALRRPREAHRLSVVSPRPRVQPHAPPRTAAWR